MTLSPEEEAAARKARVKARVSARRRKLMENFEAAIEYLELAKACFTEGADNPESGWAHEIDRMIDRARVSVVASRQFLKERNDGG